MTESPAMADALARLSTAERLQIRQSAAAIQRRWKGNSGISGNPGPKYTKHACYNGRTRCPSRLIPSCPMCPMIVDRWCRSCAIR